MTGSIYDWSLTAASNSAADGDVNWAEGQDPDTVNNSARQMMARLAEFLKDSAAIRVSSGAANTYTVTANSAPAALRDGYTIAFRAHQANTTSATISVNSYGAKSLRSRSGTALLANEILNGVVVIAQYNLATDEFIIVNSPNVWLQTLGPAMFQSQTFGLKVGDVKISMTNSPDSGFMRLRETAQVYNRADYPDLYPVMVALTGYPWGASVSASTFAVPPAAGYFLRFAATSSAVDTAGARNAGTTQAEQTAAHTHANTATVNDPGHSHAELSDTFLAAGGGTTIYRIGGNNNGHIVGTGFTGISVTMNNASSGTGTETRAKNVAFHADMLAVPALVASGLVGVSGFAFKFNSSVSAADPGSGYFALNNATVASATSLYISETDTNGVSLETMLASVPANSKVIITKVGAPANAISFTMASAATDNGAWNTFSISSASATGTISNGDPCTIVVMPAGATGGTGADGGGLKWTFDNSTTMAAPSAGGFRLNNASLASVAAAAIHYQCGETGNPDVNAFVKTWDDSTTTAHRGYLFLKKVGTLHNFAVYDITGALADNTTWAQLTLTHVASSGSFANGDVVLAQFVRTGDKGLDGAGSGTVTGVAAGDGLSAAGVGSSGGTVTVSGTLTSVMPPNAQTGTTYTFVTSDNAKLLTFSNGAAVAATLPQATSTFGTGWHSFVLNKGAGTVTITPTTSTIDGAATLALAQNQSALIVSDGTNYQVFRGSLKNSGATAGTYTNATVTVNAQGVVTAASNGTGGGGSPSIPQGRLTLTTALPVLTSTVSGATTVYYTPYVGRYVPIYNGSSFDMTDIGGELSQATTDSAKSPAACTTNSNYDLFVWSDSGTYRCTRGPLWSSDTARGTGAGTTELQMVAGIYTNKNAITNGPAANRGTYVGTIRTNGSSQVDFIVGGDGAGGVAGFVGLWNAYGRVNASLVSRDSVDSSAYASVAWRIFMNGSGNKHSFIRGLDLDGVNASAGGIFAGGAGFGANGVGLDSTTALAAGSSTGYINSTGAAGAWSCAYGGLPGLGFHYIALIEYAASGTITNTGDWGTAYAKEAFIANVTY